MVLGGLEEVWAGFRIIFRNPSGLLVIFSGMRMVSQDLWRRCGAAQNARRSWDSLVGFRLVSVLFEGCGGVLG